ncbi:MAG TPA: cell division protein FtsA [Verrucomicrobiae bacterium]|nr:cell division protein FtsA [Verrucomicrobiae bacterium]
MLRFDKVRPPVRQVVALDGGSRRFKVLLAEIDFGRVRILKEEALDLQAEGLVSPEEIKSHLHEFLDRWGRPPLALTLPEHVSTSQILDLPPAPDSEVDKLIGEESIKLSGVSESRIVYDFAPSEINSGARHQFWVTLCQEGEIRERIARLGIEHDDLCEVTTTANALISAYRAAAPSSRRSILIHLGAQTTVVVIVLAGQGVFATSFQMGGDFFTRALARHQNLSEDRAEALKREKNLLAGSDASAEFRSAVEGWVSELKGQLAEWFKQNPGAAAATPAFELIASGGGFDQPGLLEYLRTQGMPMRPWPAGPEPEEDMPGKGFEVAYGTALQALGHVPHPISLLPQDYRQAWQKRLTRQRFDLASALLIVVCLLVLGLGTWRKLSLFNTKQALLDKVQAGQTAVDANDSFMTDLMAEYESLRPVLAAQQSSLDTLKTLALLQQSRSNRSFWYILLADQQSYFSQPPALLSTNRPAKTNLLAATLEPARLGPLVVRAPTASLTNSVPARPGFIAELIVPGDAEASRQALSELVNSLKQQRLFSKVDLLSDDLRRNLADSKVTVTDRDFVLAMDFAETDFQQPAHWRRSASSAPTRPASRRPARPPWSGSDPNPTPGSNPQ